MEVDYDDGFFDAFLQLQNELLKELTALCSSDPRVQEDVDALKSAIQSKDYEIIEYIAEFYKCNQTDKLMIVAHQVLIALDTFENEQYFFMETISHK